MTRTRARGNRDFFSLCLIGKEIHAIPEKSNKHEEPENKHTVGDQMTFTTSTDGEQ